MNETDPEENKTEEKTEEKTKKSHWGSPRKQPRRGRLLAEGERAYGGPTRLSRQDALTDREVFDGIIADSAGDGWRVNGKRLPPPLRSPSELPLPLMRDIHLFVCRVVRARKESTSIPAYRVASNGELAETVFGAEYSRIEAALRGGFSTNQRRCSEHVQLFLSGYRAFGFDGSLGDPDVIAEYAGPSRKQQEIVNSFLGWIRKKFAEKIERPGPREIIPAGFPTFKPVKSSGKGAVRSKAKRPRRRNQETGRFEVPDSLSSVFVGRVVYPVEDSRRKDDSFQTRLRLRRARPAKNNRKAAELIARLFQRVGAIRIIHLDVGLRPEYAGESHAQAVRTIKEFLNPYFNHGVKNIGPFRGMIGRVAKLSYTRDRGYFCRIIFLFDASAITDFSGLDERLGMHWSETATGGRGVYATVVRGASKFRTEPRGQVRRFDAKARTELLRAVSYLTIQEEYLGLDLPEKAVTFFASDLPLPKGPPPARRGNDRIKDYVYTPSEMRSEGGTNDSEESSRP